MTIWKLRMWEDDTKQKTVYRGRLEDLHFMSSEKAIKLADELGDKYADSLYYEVTPAFEISDFILYQVNLEVSDDVYHFYKCNKDFIFNLIDQLNEDHRIRIYDPQEKEVHYLKGNIQK